MTNLTGHRFPSGVGFRRAFIEFQVLVAQASTPKDNRLRPKGWTKDGPPGFASNPKWGPTFLEATTPKGNVRDDLQFFDGTGSDVVTYKVNVPKDVLAGGTVVATLHYQAIPPFYLMQRFTTANGKDAQRLHYITSHLNLEGTAIENWKLPVAQASQVIK